MKKILKSLFFLFLLSTTINFAQEDLEIFIIDGFVTPEKPHIFKLSFYTSVPVKTKLLIDDKYKYDISNEYSEDHKIEVDITTIKFKDKTVPYKIIYENENGEKNTSDEFEVILPYDEFIFTKSGSNPFTTIFLGMLLYAIPSPNLVILKKENYFSLTKEIPLITFYGSGYNYPSGNITFEYSHIYKAQPRDIIRLGYKHFFPIKGIEYVAPGISGFSNLKGFNGIGAEVSIGLFKIYDVFTFYGKYRYNLKPNETSKYFHEISIGLYSHFFTIDI
ncbi:MAG: hypothetical protein HYS24_14425 [Ignavibacteriales bacterium]|nr:hypothetical protein [Ignavibacteriales bacterium]